MRILAMRVLVCSATELEIQPFTSRHAFPSADVTTLITGVGLLSATHALTRVLNHYRPDLIVQAGVCGSLRHHLAPCTVVAVASEQVGDAGVQENERFYSLQDLQLSQPNTFPYTHGRLQNPHEILANCGLPMVNGVTVNEITTQQRRLEYYAHVLKADIESMEGAALHYVCLQENIPFLQLRSVSNEAGERNKKLWQLQGAIDSLCTELHRILTEIKIV